MDRENVVASYLDKWIIFVMRRALWVLLFFVLLSTVSLYFTVTHIGINTSTSDMLDKELLFRQNLNNYYTSFPYNKANILLVISGSSTAAVQTASRRLANSLQQQKQFKSVFVPGNSDFFSTHRLLYLDQAKFIKFSQNLTDTSKSLTQLSQQTSASNLLTILGKLTQSDDYESNTIVTNMFTKTSHTLTAQLHNQTDSLNWNTVFTDAGNNINQQLILIEPTAEYQEVFAAGEAISLIRRIASQLNIDSQHDLQLRITGKVAMAFTELKNVSRGMGIAGLMAILLVVSLLWFGSRSFKILAFSMFTLLIGLSLTAGFAALSIGSLNLISIAFAVLYIGLGIDFSIHFCLRYQELIEQQTANANALRTTSNDVGISLIICAVSTAIGFYAFIPTDFVGLSELGIISGTGMFISLIVSLSVLPALFKLFPVIAGRPFKKTKKSFYRSYSTMLHRYHRWILSGIVVLSLISLYFVPQAYFDYDLLNMRDQKSEAVATFRELVDDGQQSPLYISVLADNQQQTLQLQTTLAALSAVEKVHSISSLIPDNQSQRLSELKKLSIALKNIRQISKSSDPISDKRSTVPKLRQSLLAINKSAAAPLYDQVSQLIKRLENLSPAQRTIALANLDTALTGSFGSSMQFLQRTLGVDEVTLESLPDDERRQWISPITERYILRVYPASSISDIQSLRKFVKQVEKITPEITGTPVISLASGDVAVAAFKQALLTALVLIALLLLVIYKNLTDTLLILTPLLLVALFTAALSVLLKIPFNFSNIIAIPLLFGIGVDNGIHMISRSRTLITHRHHVLHTSTTRAVILSALTTIVSFGNLGFSSHPGTASMGQLLTLGVLLTLASTLVILPLLLVAMKKQAFINVSH